jgi:GNAT superfamily N-acetyltransferase
MQTTVAIEILKKENLNNMVELWQNYGSTQIGPINVSLSWPKKIWLEPRFDLTNAEATTALIKALLSNPDNSLSLWGNQMVILKEELSLQKTSNLIAMSQKTNRANLFEFDEEIEHQYTVDIVTTDKDIAEWSKVCGESFDYVISPSVIERANKTPKLSLVAIKHLGEICATALLFNTGKSLGVHQIGIPTKYRGLGLAKYILNFSVNYAKTKQIEFLMLQASSAGLPLYQQMGFEHLFDVVSFKYGK